MANGSFSSLISPEHTIILVKGTTKTLELTVTDLDDDPIDITGARVLFTVKEDFEDEFPLIQKTTDVVAEAVITKPQAGIAEFFLTPSDTQNLETEFDYIYDVWVVQASGDRFAVIPPSVFKLQDSVTRIPI
jgi:hypothetical protein